MGSELRLEAPAHFLFIVSNFTSVNPSKGGFWRFDAGSDCYNLRGKRFEFSCGLQVDELLFEAILCPKSIRVPIRVNISATGVNRSFEEIYPGGHLSFTNGLVSVFILFMFGA